MTRENTPWVKSYFFQPQFKLRKDSFVQKYQVLLVSLRCDRHDSQVHHENV